MSCCYWFVFSNSSVLVAKLKLVKTNITTWFNKVRKIQHLKPNYISIKINGKKSQDKKTTTNAIKYRINHEIKFLYCKNRTSINNYIVYIYNEHIIVMVVAAYPKFNQFTIRWYYGHPISETQQKTRYINKTYTSPITTKHMHISLMTRKLNQHKIRWRTNEYVMITLDIKDLYVNLPIQNNPHITKFLLNKHNNVNMIRE